MSNNAFEASDVIGIYVTDYADAQTPMPLQISGNRANNAQVTFDGATWTPAQTIFWGDAKSDVYAYYPYSETIEDVNEYYFDLATDQTGDGYELSDFLWAKAECVAQADGAINLQMQHVMSKLIVKIVAGEDYVGSLPEDATVLLHSTVANANINLENGAVSKHPYSGAESIKMRNLGLRTSDGEKAVVYEAVVVPQMLESSVPLLEINSKSVSYLIEDPFNFRPGVVYTYTVALNTSTTSIKVDIGCELEDWNNGGGETGDGDGEEGGSGTPEEDDVEYVDLSAEGTANCYLVQATGDYKFKAVIGNTDATVGNVKTVEVLWESFGTDEMPNVGDFIASAKYKNGYICFSTPENFRNGNAVIAAKNSKGTILWSWHIWCAEEGWKEQVYFNDAGTMMDRNLGATSATPGEVGTLGLMYQWGRKDPFLGSSSFDDNVIAKSTGTWSNISGGSLTLCEENPTTFYTSVCLPNGCWESVKTIYDPCPAGWRVPDGGAEGVWAKAMQKKEAFKDSSLKADKGLNFSGLVGEDEVIYYPLSGYIYEISALNDVNFYGLYWSCSPHLSSNYAYNLYFDINGKVYYPERNNHRSQGSAVRCLKE